MLHFLYNLYTYPNSSLLKIPKTIYSKIFLVKIPKRFYSKIIFSKKMGEKKCEKNMSTCRSIS